MAQPTKYDYLNSIQYPKGQRNVNAPGYIARGIPFKNNLDAIQYIMDFSPDTLPEDHPVQYDPAGCKAKALEHQYELEYVLKILADMRNANNAEVERINSEINSQPNDLMGDVNRQVLHERLHEQIGYGSALCEVHNLICNRHWELFELGRLKV